MNILGDRGLALSRRQFCPLTRQLLAVESPPYTEPELVPVKLWPWGFLWPYQCFSWLPCRQEDSHCDLGGGNSFSASSSFPSPFAILLIWLQCPLKLDSPGLLICGHLFPWSESAKPAEVAFLFLFYLLQEIRLKALLLKLLRRSFLPHHNGEPTLGFSSCPQTTCLGAASTVSSAQAAGFHPAP